MFDAYPVRWRHRYQSVILVVSCRPSLAGQYAEYLGTTTRAQLIGVCLPEMRETLGEISSFNAYYSLPGRFDRFPTRCEDEGLLASLRAHGNCPVVIAYANDRGSGYANVRRFAASLGCGPVFAIFPSYHVTRIPRHAFGRVSLAALRGAGSVVLWVAAWLAGAALVGLCLGRMLTRHNSAGVGA